MSLPDEPVEQMLSGYLDDALGDDERAHVEQLLHSDPQIMNQYVQLKELRQSLKALAKADSNVRLDARFSDRVVEAAVSRACSEGYADDHPLVRLAEQPADGRSGGSVIHWSRIAGIAAALAATVAIAIFFRTTPAKPIDDTVAVAELSNRPEIADEGPVIRDREIAATIDSRHDRIADNPSENAFDPEMIAASNSPDATRNNLSDLDNSLAVGPRKEIAQSQSNVTDDASRSVMDDGISNNSVTPTADTNPLAAILVIEVRQTESGRASRAVRKAMRDAKIDARSKKRVTSAMASVIEQGGRVEADEKVSVLLLEAPAKSLDRFYLSLLSDKEGIDSVGMTIAMNAPVLKVINTVRAEPTEIRHGAGFELTSDSNVVDQLAMQLGKLSFAPMDRPVPTELSAGPDITAQVLVLVK